MGAEQRIAFESLSKGPVKAIACKRGRGEITSEDLERVKAEYIVGLAETAVDLVSAGSALEARVMVGQVLARPLTELEAAVVERDWRQMKAAAGKAERK